MSDSSERLPPGATATADTPAGTHTQTDETGSLGGLEPRSLDDERPHWENNTPRYQERRRGIVVEDRPGNGPSAAVIIGAALAGAVVAGAIPLMFSARSKSRASRIWTSRERGDADSDKGPIVRSH